MWPVLFDRALYLNAAEELRINERQWQAYEATGHCVLLAGPGSGKTKTLTIKLARMLSEDVEEPRGIACITYNNECARELETRLDALGIYQRPGLHRHSSLILANPDLVSLRKAVRGWLAGRIDRCHPAAVARCA